MSFDLTQAQLKYQFDLDVDVALRYADGSTSEVTSVKMPVRDGVASKASYSVHVDKEVVGLIIDPGTHLLATWNITHKTDRPWSAGGMQ